MSIKQEIERLRGELPEGVKLLAVSKFHPVEALQEAYDAGQRAFGESRPQELKAKQAVLPADIEWHMIGHLQTNKVKRVVGKVDMIQSVDSLHLLAAIQKEAAKQDIVQDVLMEINIGKEASKSGFLIDEVDHILQQMREFPNICLRGFMAIPPICQDSTENHKFFQIRLYDFLLLL